jgi:sugar lactone lactonase YvrE
VRYVDGKLFALARGVHRSAGGPQDDIEDLAGSIFEIDPGVSEPAVKGGAVGAKVRANAQLVAKAGGPPFRIWNRAMPATRDIHTDRPYCMLVYDAASKNFFVCGYSGIDLAKSPKFRKNATDSVHRFDLRSRKWNTVEQHNPAVVPEAELKNDVSSIYDPHHDVGKNPPPHGLVNGPCGAVVAGRYLYVGAKDNTALAQYDLSEIRRNPAAPPPPARFIFEGTKGHAEVEIEGHGKMVINGTCALAVHEGQLYVAFRSTSQILRFPLREDGGVDLPLKGQYIAQFPRYNPEKKGGSADIYDMAFDNDGLCYVSPGYDGAIYRFRPDPKRVYTADKEKYEPYVDLEALVGASKSGNICFDSEGNLYICCGQKVLNDSKIRGVIYRVRKR